MFVSESEGTLTDCLIQDCLQRQFQSHLLAVQQSQRLKKKKVQTGKEQVDISYSKKYRETALTYKNRMNKETNEHQLKRLKHRYECCSNIFSELESKLKAFASEKSSQEHYKVFLTASIVEGLVRMFEGQVFIRCLDRDRTVILELLPEIHQIYRDFMRREVGFEYPLNLQIANNLTLQERQLQGNSPLEKNKEDTQCIGGVILADKTGNITFKATLDSRLNILRDISLPLIRQMVWGEQGKPSQ